MPPILFNDGDSPPTYLVTCSKVSVGTNIRSAGSPRFDGAYSITKYSREAPLLVLVISSR
ncbi:unannotated protein [freshwater metagenome]|uniref:Unannotated protein n=1 Tax=freshwater metagenome TaxID=449393 RepID=A0A6J6V2S4_9ZZZZ